MALKILFFSLVYIFTYRQSYQQVDPGICWETRLNSGLTHDEVLHVSFDKCITFCKQKPTCGAVTDDPNENSPTCYLFKPNNYTTRYQSTWISWFKEKKLKETPSWCQITNCKMPEEGKIYSLTNYFGCMMDLNGGQICSGNEIVISKHKQIPLATSQQWYIKQVTTTPNVYQIINYHSQMALDATESKLHQHIAMSSSKNQHFSFSFAVNCSVNIHSVSNGKVLSNAGMTDYCLSNVYVQQDQLNYEYYQLWFFKEVTLTINDLSLNVVMTNSSTSMPLSKEILTFSKPESCEFPIEGKYYSIVNRYQCAMDLYEGESCVGNLIITYINHNDSTTSFWYIKKIKTTENTYQIINANSSLALDSNENVLRQQISLETTTQQHYTFSFGPECSIYIHTESNPNMVLSNNVISPNCQNKAAVLLQQKENFTNQQWYFTEAKMNDSTTYQRMSKNLIIILIFSVMFLL